MNETMMNNFAAVANDFVTRDYEAQNFETQYENVYYADDEKEQCENTAEPKMTIMDYIKKWEPGVMKYAGVGGLFAMVITSLVFVVDALMSAEQGNVGGIILSIISVGTLLAQIVTFVAGRVSFWNEYVKKEKKYDYNKNKTSLVLYAISSIGIWVVSPILMGIGAFISYKKHTEAGKNGKDLWLAMCAEFSVAVMVAFGMKTALCVVSTICSIIMCILTYALALLFLPLIIRAVRFVIAIS